MSGLEQILASASPSLASCLDYSAPAGLAPYVTQKKECQVYPAGGDQYRPEGVRLMRFAINSGSGASFIDMSSLALKATVTEMGGSQPLEFLSPSLGGAISQVRVWLGGTLIEQVDYANRVEGMLERFESWEKRCQRWEEGWGKKTGTNAGDDFTAEPILASGSKTVIWRPTCLGICSQKNVLPCCVAFSRS